MSVQAAAHVEEPRDHGLVAEHVRKSVTEGVIYDKRPVTGADGKPVAGLYNAWITLNNPGQFNSYTTEMVK
ncbi:MAG: 6-oxocyclohex-1-ene-1-carbonyl-CoA hydratase, partial [Rhodoplanes sp.]